MTRDHVGSWIRQHPSRALVYLVGVLIVSTAIWGVGSLLNGAENERISRVARSASMRDWAERHFHIHYSIGQVNILKGGQDCGLAIEVRSLDVALLAAGAGRAEVGEVVLCDGFRAAVANVRLGSLDTPDKVEIDQARLAWPRAQIQGVQFKDPNGPIVGIYSARTELPSLSSTIDQLRVLPAQLNPPIEVRNISTRKLVRGGNMLTLEDASMNGLVADIEQANDRSWNFVSAATRLVGWGKSVAQILRASRALVADDCARLRRILILIVVLFCLAICLLKLWLMRWVHSVRVRYLAALTPVILPVGLYLLLFRVLSFWIFTLGLFFGTLAALLFWCLVYRRAPEWHQRFEPAIFDLFSPFAILPALIVSGYLAVLLSPIPSAETIRLANAELNNAVLRLGAKPCSAEQLAAVHVDDAGAKNLVAKIDIDALAVRSVYLARAFARGTAGSPVLNRLEELRYVPPQWRRASTIGFCINSEITGDGNDVLLPDCARPDSNSTIVNVAAKIDFERRSAKTDSRIISPVASMEIGASADLQRLVISKIQTLARSNLTVRDGNGQVSWDQLIAAAVALRGVEVRSQSADAQVDDLSLRASAPVVCPPDKFNLTANVWTALVQSRGYGLELRRGIVQLTRSFPSLTYTSLHADTIRVNGSRAGDSRPWLDFRFPHLEFQAQTRSPGRTGDAVSGQARVTISRSRQEQALDLHSRFALWSDISRGRVKLTVESARLEQSIVPQLRSPVALSLESDLQVRSLASPFDALLNTAVQIPRAQVESPPLGAEINDLAINTRYEPLGSKNYVHFKTGWSQAEHPGLPRSLQLKDISLIALKNQGTARNIPGFDAVSADLQSLRRWIDHALPPLPANLDFQLEGEASAASLARLHVSTRDGKSVALNGIDSRLVRLEAPSARLASAQLTTYVNAIQNGQGVGTLQLSATTSVADGRIAVALQSPINATLQTEPQRIKLTISKEIPLGTLMEQVDPLLREFGFDLSGIRWGAHIRTLGAEARFSEAATLSGSSVNGFIVNATVGEGELVAVDFARMLRPTKPAFLRTLVVSQTAPLSVRIDASNEAFPSFEATTRAPALTFDLNQGHQQSTLSADAGLRGILTFDLQPTPPLFVRSRDAIRGIAKQAYAAAAAFSLGTGPQISHLHWKAEVTNLGEPALSIAPTRIELRLRPRLENLSWSSGSGFQSQISGDAELRSDFKVQSDHLIGDAMAALTASYSFSGGPTTTLKLRVPILLALRNQLVPAQPGGDLWDTSFYRHLWQQYQPSNAVAAEPWLQRDELLFRGISLLNLSANGPLHSAIGYDGPLQLDLPFSARLFFGKTQGELQARLDWKKDAAAVTSRTQLTFDQLQAGAIGLGSDSGHLALLEDSLSGSASFRTDDLLVGRGFLGQLQTTPWRLSELDKVGIFFEAESDRNTSGHCDSDPSSASQILSDLPGIFQLQTSLDVRFYNDLLNALGQELKLIAPPVAISYENLKAAFRVERGVVQPNDPLLRLHCVHIPQLSPFQIATDIRIHLGKDALGSENLRIGNLIYFFQRLGSRSAN